MEPCGDLVDQAFSQFNENSFNNQDPHSQVENDETPVAEYLNENFMPQIFPDYEMAKSINSLNSKQREVINVVHK